MAELKSRYEVRSHEVQEVMNRPPHFVVSWGNTMIVLAIVAAMILINNIRLEIKEQLPAVLASRYSDGPSAVGQRLVFSLNMPPQHRLLHGNRALVCVFGGNAVSAGGAEASVDSVWSDGHVTWLALHVAQRGDELRTRDNKVLSLSKGMPVSIDVVTGQEKVLISMFRKILR
ncbi:hypothetical protein HHL17_22560 [Chitinophaga sp. G-6-1-13]|uniref:Uncharacterized protein n=1 Tax=Chitinophaga fulva TaxID=2728842 RepID=A0A848GR41_9BACT|nr:hypothetical protein [Chitinophaga fulva]NML40001.1 hypothetical protein [Chitinophaga fulva]